jgi:sugar transferase (PEP-CTERM system associated)
VISEAVVSYLALVLAMRLRFGPANGSPVTYLIRTIPLGVVACVCIVCLYYYDLYDSMLLIGTLEARARLIQVIGTTCVILSLIYYISPGFRTDVPLFIPGVLFMGICLAGWREMFSFINRSTRLGQRVLLLGEGPLAIPIVHEIRTRPELGFKLVGFVSGQSCEYLGMSGLRRIGGMDNLTSAALHEKIERIIVAIGDRRGHLPVGELLELKTRGIAVEDGIAFYEAASGKIDLGSLVPSHLLFSDGFRVSNAMLVFKRISSLALSLALLTLALPIMGLVAIAIRLDSKGPVLFRQRRVGKDGRLFTLYKFRSMKMSGNANAHGNGVAQPAAEDDKRFTRIGRTIRRLRVDELPQLYNILRGDMDFVGPRPFMLEEEEQLACQIPYYRQRWSVRPGATGWAQVRRPYCATLEDNRDKLAYDLFYIKNLSPGLDILILLRTVKILIWGRGSR